MNQFKRAQVIMLSTENQSRLFKYADNILQSQPGLQYSFEPIKTQHLYIISDDEIKEGDWCLDMEAFIENQQNWKNIFIYKSVGEDHWDNKKIIATTDTSLYKSTGKAYQMVDGFKPIYKDLPQPSQQFIERYIESYNKGEIITDVLVEYETSNSMSHSYYTNKLKINPKDNTITIKKLKDSWNREEVVKLLEEVRWQAIGDPLNFTKNFNNWIKENL